MARFEAAVTALFHARFQSLFRYLDRLSGDPDLAADLAQEAFVRLYERGAMPDDAPAWLATVATNLFRDSHRRTQRRDKIMEFHSDTMSPDSLPAADAVMEDDEVRDTVRAALDSLPLRDRQLLLLRHEGYSYRELAEVTGVAEGSVGTLLVRATRAFQQAFTAQSQVTDVTPD